jgi:hypothetical protein
MTPDVKISFLTYYIRSLAERTRVEKSSTKFGFDWVIYNLALADNLTPYRLPFIRSGPTEISKTKTEPEFGIDSSFLSSERTVLTIFVLKDEVLSNTNWTAHGFDSDLRRASAPDLTPPEFKEVREVRIVLAYNKDEDQTGIQLYTNLTRSLGTKISDGVKLTFERWNLTTLAELAQNKLLTPSLLPQQFFSLFGYICSQFGDFKHGSDEWTNQLVPNWQRFIGDLLKDNADERSVRLLPVALIVLREHGNNNLSAETGWIDLAEWAMLAVWNVHESTQKESVRQAVFQMWVGFYVVELERYYLQHANELAVEHSLEIHGAGNYVDAIASAVIAYWHVARLGILALSYAELISDATPEQQNAKLELAKRTANQLVSLLNANPSVNRPLLDINHIELFLIWRSLWQLGRVDDIYKWLHSLRSSLLVRRAGTIQLPFIEGYNSLELVFEFVATGEKPPEFCDQSSMLLLCILELCFSLEPDHRDELIALYYREIILGQDSYGAQMKDRQPIDLMGWLPPEDWLRKVFTKSLADEGESQTVECFNSPSGKNGSAIASKLEIFIRQSRASRKTSLPSGIPISAVILACLKHRSPLPAEIWRQSIFGDIEPSTSDENPAAKD